MRKRIYIATPISVGDLCENVNRATEAFLKLVKAGYSPFNPALSVYSKPAVFHDCPCYDRVVVCQATVSGHPDLTHEDWMQVDLSWVSVSDAVLRLPGESKGADREVALATELGILVCHSVEELAAFFCDDGGEC